MSSLAKSNFYFFRRQLKRASHLIVGHQLEPSQDIVVVTGGSSGLGREIASQFAEIGARVAVFDITIPLENQQLPAVSYFKCDVGNPDDVSKCYNQISSSLGSPTVLVNNAGITSNKTVLELSCEEIEQIIRVNLLSSFFTIKAFLPGMLQKKRGYIITVGSVLGYMSPARLSAYGASKSGLVALHESLTYELGSPSLCATGVKTLLVCPGQMKTSMFNGVITPWRWLAPELEPSYVGHSIIEAMEHGKRGEIKLPLYGNFLPVFRAMPWPVTEIARRLSGIDKSMRTFKTPKHDQEDIRSLFQSCEHSR